MPERGYEDLGPSIDLGPVSEDEPISQLRSRSQAANSRSGGGGGSGGKGGSLALALLALVVALVSMGLGLFAVTTTPEPLQVPPAGPGVVPGATAERVAKLEKDVSQLMLRMVALEKELSAVKGRAGAITKLSQMSASLEAIKERLERLEVDSRIASLKKKPSETPAPAASQARTEQPPAKPKAAPAKGSKQVYQVRRGDTLWTVSQRYKVTMRDLRKWNNLSSRDVLQVGQKLIIYK